MVEVYYSVYLDGDLYAEKCTLEAAMLLVKAAFDTFFEDPELNIRIERLKSEVNDDH